MTDSLAPDPQTALADWAARIAADRQQVERHREIDDPADFYAPVADRFRLDPRRTDDPTLNALLHHAHTEERWLDVGAGAGRYALPLALAVREVTCVEPSEGMLDALREDMRSYAIRNINIIASRWPMDDPPAAEVALMAHVGYDIAEIGPFLDCLEQSARRLCIAVMGESAMTAVANLFWEAIHGEPRVRLPALPELMVLLVARGRLPQVRLVERRTPTFESIDEALAMARRQLWLREGSDKDRKLQQLLADELEERDRRYSFEREPTKIGVVAWEPG
jgi:SAM-dependent methyltransferase